MQQVAIKDISALLGKKALIQCIITIQKAGRDKWEVRVRILLEKQSGFYTVNGQHLNSKNFFEQRLVPYFSDHDKGLRDQMLAFYQIILQCLHLKINRHRKIMKFPRLISNNEDRPISEELTPKWLEQVLAARKADLASIQSVELNKAAPLKPSELSALFDSAELKADSKMPILAISTPP